MKILLVEDDRYTVAKIIEILAQHQYVVEVAADSEKAIQLMQSYEYDLLIADVVLPGLDGISLCCYLREQNYQLPILLLSVKASVSDRVFGLNAGADDYLVKPFDSAELVARVGALLRRREQFVSPALTWGALRLFPNTRRVTWQGKPLNLTAKEFRLLQLFLENPQRIFSKDVILDRLWTATESAKAGTVAAHMKGLRQKLKAAGVKVEIIETIYGVGYQLGSPLDLEQSVQGSPVLPIKIEPSPAQLEVMAVAAEVLQEIRASLNEETALFEQVIAQLSAGTLERELRRQAERHAHQLAGSLGSLGLSQGFEAAQQIELLLQGEMALRQTATRQLQYFVELLKQALVAIPMPIAPTSPRIASARLLVIDDDRILVNQLRLAAVAAGFNLEIATTLADGRRAIAQNPPDAILLDLSFNEDTEDGLKLLAELDEQNSSIPVLAFTVRDSLTDRITVTRLGGRAFLHKPISISEVFNAIAQVIDPPPIPEAKILVVDDDPQILATFVELLPAWGLQVTTLAQPQRFWELLRTAVPDLLVLDISMPQFSGIELCQVVRHDPRWENLPILMLLERENADLIHQIFMAGADDYICKPIVAPELITRLLNRLEGIRLRQQPRS
ncbi:MAG: Regulator of RpoS [Chroococcidiopsis cubana SAG 39.79]|uniref:Transcriptional regulator n=1 Tax=Chroococcidiopsis cubana SAG 39.79 TaxID=388085 RepID=A0AB37UC05_9CYAN|nr:response regulator [Chroococcidiopsis cubana]MDZ4875749.1 Regulator of RpoS [Chroococcidiopsis cubana SAG 39.79]PSB63416.1 transcriptional regulator [Chroococcidiopsis cubana CCALA 043]RUT04944.1 transcriptional regulator [Chroococcidiopsis cubana SAG 39.79]